jgi:hypothetical protein
MTEDLSRQPIECLSCGTVNAWMSQTCRSCQASLSEKGKPLDLSSRPPQPKESSSVDPGSMRSSQPPPKGRLGILWILLGAMAYFAVVQAGANVLQNSVLAKDPRVAGLLEKSMAAGGTSDALSEEEQALLEEHKPLIFAAILPVMLGAPLLIGFVLGRLTGSLTEAMWAMGVGCVLANTAAVQSLALLLMVLLSSALTAGIAALGALPGRAWHRAMARRNSG